MIQVDLLTRFRGKLVGEDEMGNKYFEDRKPNSELWRPRRWVKFAKKNYDASQIPAAWFGWLHYMHSPLNERSAHNWEKPHQENKSGTPDRYLPKHHSSNPAASSEKLRVYQPWSPEESS